MNINFSSITGNIVDVINNKIFAAGIIILDGQIVKIIEISEKCDRYIIPGFIDSHIHIESSMMPPSEFAKIAVKHGTIAAVCDPHEIANVLGIDGVKYMIDDSKNVPLKFYFGAPSCVPATCFETSGGNISSKEIEQLIQLDEIKCLAEVMNFPGVINDDKELLEKINIAKKYNKQIDGHAPGLRGKDLEKYINAGINTDHECFSYEEAKEKIEKGMKILIREGSAAKNFNELCTLIDEFPDMIMLCSDDKHPNDLVKGHINLLVKEAIKKGIDPIKVLKTVSCNPIKHYDLNIGLLQKGDSADFIIVDNLNDFNIEEVYVSGNQVYGEGKTNFIVNKPLLVNNFIENKIKEEDIEIKNNSEKIKVIQAINNQIITNKIEITPKVEDEIIKTDLENDILKIVVVNRYKKEKPAVAFIKGFGLKKGAIASSISHDSHNIIAVGVNDEDLVEVINAIFDEKGGIGIVYEKITEILPLPIAGLMSEIRGEDIAERYEKIDNTVKQELESKLDAPFMTLSFMALLVIPSLKISDKGLFDGEKFNITDLYID